MKIWQRSAAMLAAVMIMSGSFAMIPVKADQPPESTDIAQETEGDPWHAGTDTENRIETDSGSGIETETEIESEIETEIESETELEIKTKAEATTEIESDIENEAETESETETETETQIKTGSEESEIEMETTTELGHTPGQSAEMAVEESYAMSAPAFHARIVYELCDYFVIGTFTDFTPDITRIDTMYSLDGENWQTAVGGGWNLGLDYPEILDTDDEDRLNGLQNQRCLFGYYEPLKSYKTGEIDCFYVRLRITDRSGSTYDTESEFFGRGEVQPLPEGAECKAFFSSAMTASEANPDHPRLPIRFGRYQLTVPADATASEIAAMLPKTLPIRVEIWYGTQINASAVVDCPVAWRSLDLPGLSAGESITVSDAAEKIQVPAGTQIKTPFGIYVLEEPLALYTEFYYDDRVELVLNVSSEDRSLTGALRQEIKDLQIALYPKPTGATAIQAYVMTEGASEWTKLTGHSILKEMNAQIANAGSGYVLLLRSDQEPFRSYLEAVDAGDVPVPFFVGLKVEGGVYDGRQLILAWPDIYDKLPDLPEVGGAGGNEGNAGADNKDDSTEDGQRPDLPWQPDDDQQERQPVSSPVSEEEKVSMAPADASVPDEYEDVSIPYQAQKAEDIGSGQRPGLPQMPQGAEEAEELSETAAENPADRGGNRALEWLDSTVQPPLVVQAAPERKNEGDTAAAVHNLDEKENGQKRFLPAAVTAATAVACIGAVVFKAAGYNLLRRLAGFFRKIAGRRNV